MDAEKFAELRRDYVHRKFPEGIPPSKDLPPGAEWMGNSGISAKDDAAISGAVYKELLGGDAEAKWSVLVQDDAVEAAPVCQSFYVVEKGYVCRQYVLIETDTVESAIFCRDFLALMGYEGALCADVGGELRTF